MKPWKKWLLRVGLGVIGLPLLFAVGHRYYTRWEGEKRLAKVQADLDAADPGWRLDDLLAAREAKFPPDEENVMVLVQRIAKQEPQVYKEWSSRVGVTDWLPDPEYNHLPDPAAAAEAKSVRDECLDIILEARRIRHMTKPGGYRLDVKPMVINTLLEPTQQVRFVAALLQLDAVIAALDGDQKQAVESIHAILNAGHGIGDEPTLISMLVRMAIAAIAKQAAERVLALGEPRAGLAELQEAFALEAREPLLMIGLRGERAMFDRMFENLENGAITLNDLEGGRSKSLDPLEAASWWIYQSRVPDDHAFFLETVNRLIDIARKPVHEWKAEFDLVEQRLMADRVTVFDNHQHFLSHLMMPAWGKVMVADLRTKANLLSAATGIACERFRQANGRWPNSLAEIPKDILPAVPLDPFDGQPLRYRRTDDGAVVYAVGPDLTDDDGNLSVRGDPGTDYGFRLWDVPHRRVAPLPPAVDDDNP